MVTVQTSRGFVCITPWYLVRNEQGNWVRFRISPGEWDANTGLHLPRVHGACTMKENTKDNVAAIIVVISFIFVLIFVACTLVTLYSWFSTWIGHGWLGILFGVFSLGLLYVFLDLLLWSVLRLVEPTTKEKDEKPCENK